MNIKRKYLATTADITQVVQHKKHQQKNKSTNNNDSLDTQKKTPTKQQLRTKQKIVQHKKHQQKNESTNNNDSLDTQKKSPTKQQLHTKKNCGERDEKKYAHADKLSSF